MDRAVSKILLFIIALLIAIPASMLMLTLGFFNSNGENRAVEIARDFIVQAPTFRFDGILETLNVTKVSVLESLPVQYVITITFESRHAGYGDRTGQGLAQVITPHTAVVKVVRDNVVSAILDDKWDEINQEFIETDGVVNKLTWTRTGGFIGLNEELVIKNDGSASYKCDLFGDAELILDRAEVEELFNKASFFTEDIEYGARVDVADYFIYTLTVETASDTRTITWVDDWAADETLPRELLELQSHVQAIIEDIHEKTGSSNDVVDRAVEIARDFIVQAPTFRYDGIPETLNVTKVSVLESFPVQYVITITFESRHAGYGDRTGQGLAQVITPHTAVVKVVRDNVVSAILDNTWDEINQKPLG